MPDQSGWIAKLLANLGQSGPAGQFAADYVRRRGVRLSLHRQTTAARLRLGARIEIHPRYADGSPEAPYTQSLVIHEVCHLRQAVVTALSVYGELEAWQAQFGYLVARTGHYHEVPQHARTIERLMSLPLGWDRGTLQIARNLMRDYAGRLYRVDLLPLYPLHRELIWAFGRARPVDVRHV